MVKERIILELMKELGIKTNDLILAEPALNENGELALEVFLKGGGRTRNLNFFDENPDTKPEGVIIDKEIYPFILGDFYASLGSGGTFKLYDLIERGFILPSEQQLNKLAKHYTEYKAIARLLGVGYYSKCAVRQAQNRQGEIRLYDFEKKMYTTQTLATPFFLVKKFLWSEKSKAPFFNRAFAFTY